MDIGHGMQCESKFFGSQAGLTLSAHLGLGLNFLWSTMVEHKLSIKIVHAIQILLEIQQQRVDQTDKQSAILHRYR